MQDVAQMAEIVQTSKQAVVTASVLSIKDYFQIGTWIIGMIVGCLAIFKGFSELSQSRLLRERELRWSQAKVAKDLLSEFESNDEYKRACRMLDWKKYCFELSVNESYTITRAEVLHALRVEKLVFSDKERFIRESFIELFHCFEWLEHFVDRDLIGVADIKPVLAYRVESMVLHVEVFNQFLNKYDYTEAVQFLERFESWAQSDKASQQTNSCM